MRKVDTSLIVRLCLPQSAVGLFTTMLNNYLIYFYQPSKTSGIPDLIPQGRLVLACVFALFVSFPFAVLNVLPGAMMADIIQYDTVTTGVNQEGIFGAARSFIVKMGNSLAIMIVPSLIVTGAAAGENVGVLGLKLTAVAGAVFCILAIFVLLRYRESEVLAVIAGSEKGGQAQ